MITFYLSWIFFSKTEHLICSKTSFHQISVIASSSLRKMVFQIIFQHIWCHSVGLPFNINRLIVKLMEILNQNRNILCIYRCYCQFLADLIALVVADIIATLMWWMFYHFDIFLLLWLMLLPYYCGGCFYHFDLVH